ncbi:MAG: hypothetical protein IJ168_03395 [Eubacterium sp.]|nr:hypothetical protein [Eubacterium sp.]
MHNYLKRGISLFLCLAMVFALSACSGSTLTEANITKTVELVEKALRDFDKETLQKYVNSKTLDYIIKFAGSKEQFDTIGKLLFEKLELNVKSVDLDNSTVTLEVLNLDMHLVGERYAKVIQVRSHGKATEMLSLLSDDDFLDLSVRSLTAQISQATVPDNPTEVTVRVQTSGKNLVLVLDEAAEDAVSGGVLTAVTNVFSPTDDSEEETTAAN